MDNKTLALQFREIKALLKAAGENNQWRLKAYDRAANQLDLLGTELKDLYSEGGPAKVNEFLSDVKAIGAKSASKINTVLETGTCPELEDLRSKVGRNQMMQQSFEANYVGDGIVRRPWNEANEVANLVFPVVREFFSKVTICGSYRRKKPTVKDLDFICVGPKDAESLFDKVIEKLGVKEVIKKGPAQTSFWFGGFRIDLWGVPKESHGAAILFATGSADFNIQMRGWLKANGMKINRYALMTRDGKILASETEQQIFAAIGMKWVEPSKRINFRPSEFK